MSAPTPRTATTVLVTRERAGELIPRGGPGGLIPREGAGGLIPRGGAGGLIPRGGAGGLEVLLVERAPGLRFFGGYWALPGGVLGPEDRRDEPAGELDREEAALRRCALRELFEETGVLPPPLAAALGARERAELRAGLVADERGGGGDGDRRERGGASSAIAAAAAARWRALAAPLDASLSYLRLYCTLTTPAFFPRRYATRFYHLPLPAGETPEIVPGELRAGRFVRPADALDAWTRGEERIVPPLVFLLGLLREHDLEGFFTAADAAARRFEAGLPHPVRFSPGVETLPLRTPTLPPATTTNAYLVGCERLFVVDPATYEEAEQARLFAVLDARRAAGVELAGVLVTHHHRDHVGAVAATSRRYGLPVLAHARTLARLPEPVAETRALTDGAELALGRAPDGTDGWTLRALHTPGHDAGHLAFQEDRYGSVIAGDLVSTVSTIVIEPPEGHLATYLASLERLLALGSTTLYPAHGPAHPEAPVVLRHYLAHRRVREEALVAALAAAPGSRPEELVPAVYADTDPRLFDLAACSLRAGLQKLAEERRARRDGEGWALVEA